MEAERAASVGQQLAEALAYAHAQGVVHRDVKPSNVLVCDGEDRVLLADFGIAQLVGTAEHNTKTGETIGSPAYLAPEQVAGEAVTPTADVFSLGLVLLEAMTGVRAYVGAPIEAAVARLHAAPSIPSYLHPKWRELIARMTHREAAERPTAGDVASELREFFAAEVPDVSGELDDESGVRTGELELTADVPLPAPAAPRVREELQEDDPELAFATPRHRVRTFAVLGLLVVLALIASVAFGLWSGDTKKDPVPVVPSGVPARLQQPLKDLHTAIEGHQR